MHLLICHFPPFQNTFRSILQSKCYNAASALLDSDVYCVDPSKTAVTPSDVLLYCYYGGMVAAGGPAGVTRGLRACVRARVREGRVLVHAHVRAHARARAWARASP